MHTGVSLVIFTVLIAALFRFLPDAEIDWSDVWIGAVATTLLFWLGQWGLGLYLSYSKPTSARPGRLARARPALDILLGHDSLPRRRIHRSPRPPPRQNHRPHPRPPAWKSEIPLFTRNVALQSRVGRSKKELRVAIKIIACVQLASASSYMTTGVIAAFHQSPFQLCKKPPASSQHRPHGGCASLAALLWIRPSCRFVKTQSSFLADPSRRQIQRGQSFAY